MAFGIRMVPSEEYKLVVIVRKDLKMGTGKIAAQVGHAAVECALFAKERNRKAFDAWYKGGQRKVVLRVDSLEELHQYLKLASSNGLHVALITDAGRTQVEPGSETCVGIGPAPESEIDRITGDLKMLRSQPFYPGLGIEDLPVEAVHRVEEGGLERPGRIEVAQGVLAGDVHRSNSRSDSLGVGPAGADVAPYDGGQHASGPGHRAHVPVAVGEPVYLLPVGDVIDLPGGGGHDVPLPGYVADDVRRIGGGALGVDTPDGAARSGQDAHLPHVSLDHRDASGAEEAQRDLRAVTGGADANRVEDHGDPLLARQVGSEHHGFDGAVVEGPDVEDHAGCEADHLGHILDLVGHDGRSAGAEAYVGAVVDGHIVGDVVNQRLRRTDLDHVIGWLEIHGLAILRRVEKTSLDAELPAPFHVVSREAHVALHVHEALVGVELPSSFRCLEVDLPGPDLVGLGDQDIHHRPADALVPVLWLGVHVRDVAADPCRVLRGRELPVDAHPAASDDLVIYKCQICGMCAVEEIIEVEIADPLLKFGPEVVREEVPVRRVDVPHGRHAYGHQPVQVGDPRLPYRVSHIQVMALRG